jgi:hypothetical protein
MRMFALSALCAFALAGDAAAQGVAFTSTSLPRQMRQEGLTETAGEVVLTALNSGTIPANSSIDIVFSAAITNNSAVSTANISLFNNISCAGPSGGVACPTTAALIGSQTVRLSFASSKSFVTGDGINISRVRVNANSSIGIGSVTATMSGSSSNPATNPITFTDPQRQIGVLSAAVSANFNHSAATANPVTQLQTCAMPNVFLGGPPSIADFPVPTDNPGIFFVRVNEIFPGAFTTLAQETAFSLNLPPTNGLLITITISNVLAGLTLGYAGNPLVTFPSALNRFTSSTVSAGAPFPSSAVDQTVGGTPLAFTFPIIVSDVSQVERITFAFFLKPTTVSTSNPLAIPNIGTAINIQATVQVVPITFSDSTILRFAANQIGPTIVATISDCFVPTVQGGQIISE